MYLLRNEKEHKIADMGHCKAELELVHEWHVLISPIISSLAWQDDVPPLIGLH